MGWNIPDIPQKSPLPKLKYRLWVLVLLLILMVNVTLIVFLKKPVDYISIFFYGILPPVLGWLCILGVTLNRYEQSVAACISWNEEKIKTDFNWQQWSRKQLAIVANVTYTPDQNGVDALLSEIDDIPAYPKKARKLFAKNNKKLPFILKSIHNDFEKQRPGFQENLNDIYLLCADGVSIDNTSILILQQWDLFPKTIKSINDIQPFVDMELDGFIIVLCLQAFTEDEILPHSEFVSAQILTSSTFAKSNNLDVIAGLGRILPLEPEGLEENLNVLCHYNRLYGGDINHVWLSNYNDNSLEIVMCFSEKENWQLPKRQPLHLLEYSYGPPGELMFPISLALLAHSAKQTDKDQLLVFCPPRKPDQQYLCLITRRLFL